MSSTPVDVEVATEAVALGGQDRVRDDADAFLALVLADHDLLAAELEASGAGPPGAGLSTLVVEQAPTSAHRPSTASSAASSPR